MSKEKSGSDTILKEIAEKIGDREYKGYYAGTGEFTEINVSIYQDRSNKLVFAEDCDPEQAKKVVQELKNKGMQEDKSYSKKDAAGVFVYREVPKEEEEKE